MKCLYILGLSLLLVHGLLGGPKSKLKKFLSHDSALIAAVFTVAQEGNGDSESRIEFRTSDGKLIGAKSFMSEDHAHGLGIVKAEWTLDSRYFVFSTIASGGRNAGYFPTFFFSRSDHQLHALDKFARGNIIDPEFELGFPNSVSVIVEDRSQRTQKPLLETRNLRLDGFSEK